MSRTELNVDHVEVGGLLTLREFNVVAGDLDANGVVTLSAGHEGVTMIVGAGLVLQGIQVLDTDDVTDITEECGGMTLFLATDDGPYPQGFLAVPGALGVPEAHRFDCPTASGGLQVPVAVGRLQVSIRYSSKLSRWVLPNWGA